MRKITCITSFDKNYYEHTGKVFLSSWLKYWSDDFHLVIYNEDFRLPDNLKYTQIGFDQLDPDYEKFQQEDHFGFERHITQTKRFSKKAYSVIHGMEHIDTDILIWLDADTVTKAPVTPEWFEDIIPNGFLSAHLGVIHHMSKTDSTSPEIYNCETGFFALNKQHPEFKNFSNRYRERYVNREFNDLRRPYDGDVYGAVVTEFHNKGVQMNDLNPNRHKTPFARCVLGEILHHFKHRAKRVDDFEKYYNTKIKNKT